MTDGTEADKQSFGDPLSRVLALTPIGRQELRDPQSGLSLPQRWLLGQLDGESSLEELAARPGSPAADRLPRDAAKLASLGLALDMGEPGPSASSFGPSTQYGDITLSLPLDGSEAAAPPSPAPTSAAPARRAALWLAVAVLGGAGAVAAWVASRTADAPGSATLAAAPAVASARAAPAASPAVPSAAELTPASSPAAPASADANGAPVGVAAQGPAVPAAALPAALTDRPPGAPAAPPTGPTTLPAPAAPPGRLAGADPAVGRGASFTTGAGPRSTFTPSGGTAAARGAVGPAPALSASPAVAPPPPSTTSTSAATVATAAPVVSATPAAAPPVLASPTPQPAPGAAPSPTTAAPPAVLPPQAAAPAAPALQAVAAPPPSAVAAAPLRPIALVEPTFPREGQGIGARGVVVQARLVVAPNGTVSQVAFPQSSPATRVFERAARSALLQWRFPEGTGERVVTQSLRFSEE